MDLIAYLRFGGQCEVAFTSYQRVLRGKNLRRLIFAEAPRGGCFLPAPQSRRRRALWESL